MSQGAYARCNLGGSGDEPAIVASNRHTVQAALALPQAPHWLRQVHGVSVADLGHDHTAEPTADAAIARQPGTVCAVLTADCLPLLVAARDGSAVAAIHAGWRGLAAGVVEATMHALAQSGRDLAVWLGPAIGPAAYEVGDEVRDAFVSRANQAAMCFAPTRPGHWLCDLYALARQRLTALGVRDIQGGEFCTHGDAGRFYSYRRDGACGRMASLIWITPRIA
jgi:hypothetical protein